MEIDWNSPAGAKRLQRMLVFYRIANVVLLAASLAAFLWVRHIEATPPKYGVCVQIKGYTQLECFCYEGMNCTGPGARPKAKADRRTQ